MFWLFFTILFSDVRSRNLEVNGSLPKSRKLVAEGVTFGSCHITFSVSLKNDNKEEGEKVGE